MRADIANAAVNVLRLLLQLHQADEQNVRIGEMQAEVDRMRQRVVALLQAQGG